MTRPRRVASATAAALLVLVAAGCGDDGNDGNDGTGGSDAGGGGSTTLTVFAAASLTSTFEQLGDEFEKSHDGVDVEFSFGGSSDLVSQLQEGAPADVFASADTANMDKLTADDLQAGDPQDFATNTLEIATPAGNPAGVTSFADLANPDLKVVICAPEVPCGAATTKMEQATGVDIAPVSEEQSVTDVLGKVSSGEADAGLVYVTDVTAAGDDVTGVPFAESDQVVNTYPILALEGSEHRDLAQEFVDLVLSQTGQDVLAQAGFGAP